MTNKATATQPKPRHPYGPKKRSRLECKDPTRTKQQFAAESNINNIMAKYQKTGLIDHVSRYGPTYGFAEPVDFQEALNTVRTAQDMFNALPSSWRARFENDPAKFLDFVQDPENEEEMRHIGILPKAEPKNPPKPEEDTPKPEEPG